MQVSPVAQNNTNFQCKSNVHMSLRTAYKTGFSKRTLLNKCPGLKKVPKEFPIKITHDPEDWYKLIKSPKNQTEKAMFNFLGALFSLPSSWLMPAIWPQIGTALSITCIVSFCYFVYCLVMNMVQNDKEKECSKIIIQAGEKYENGELQGKKSPKIITNYEALERLPFEQLLELSTEPGKINFETVPDKVNDIYEWHIERKRNKVTRHYNNNKKNDNNDSSGEYYFNGITWIKY